MKTDRLLALLSILSETDKITVRELSERFEVSKRTILRDLDALGCAGIPIVSYLGPGGGVSIMDSYRLDYKILSSEDKEKIFTALKGLKSIDNDHSITSLIAKLVPENESSVFSQSDYVIDLSSWFNDSAVPEKIALFRRSIHQCSLVRMEYISRNSRSIRVIEPHKLVFKQSCWYIYGYCRQRNDFCMFRLSRAVSLEILEETFRPRPIESIPFPQDFGVDIYPAGSKRGLPGPNSKPIFDVVLEYDISDEFELTKTFDASYFRPRQDAASGSGHTCPTDHTRNSGYICFQTSDLDFAATLIFGLLDKVKAVSPPELRRIIRKRLENILPLYNSI